MAIMADTTGMANLLMSRFPASRYFASLSGWESFPSGQSQVRTPKRGRTKRFRMNHPAMINIKINPSFKRSLPLQESASFVSRFGCNRLRAAGMKTGTRNDHPIPHPFPYVWCRSRDLNPDGFCPLPPQDSVSTRFHHFGIQIALPCLPERACAGNLSVWSAFVNVKRTTSFPRRGIYFAG
jgi:hypothetical protein